MELIISIVAFLVLLTVALFLFKNNEAVKRQNALKHLNSSVRSEPIGLPEQYREKRKKRGARFHDDFQVQGSLRRATKSKALLIEGKVRFAEEPEYA